MVLVVVVVVVVVVVIGWWVPVCINPVLQLRALQSFRWWVVISWCADYRLRSSCATPVAPHPFTISSYCALRNLPHNRSPHSSFWHTPSYPPASTHTHICVPPPPVNDTLPANPLLAHTHTHTCFPPPPLSSPEDVFDDAFWGGLDVVVNALDNVNARCGG